MTHPNVTRYNSMFNQWELMSPMPEAVLHPAVAATNQRIYVFGGENAMQNPVRIIQVQPFVFFPGQESHELQPFWLEFVCSQCVFVLLLSENFS